MLRSFVSFFASRTFADPILTHLLDALTNNDNNKNNQTGKTEILYIEQREAIFQIFPLTTTSAKAFTLFFFRIQCEYAK